MTSIGLPEARTVVNVLETGSRDFWHRPTIRIAFEAITAAVAWNRPGPYRFRLIQGECPARFSKSDLPDDELARLGHHPARFDHKILGSADALAASVAREMYWEVVESQPGVRGFPADWDAHKPADPRKGNPAGFIRNQEMVDYLLRQDGLKVCIGFPTRFPISGGTADCLRRAHKAGIRTWVAPLGMGSDVEGAA
jgi:hypothetical protein